jgi:hypothetical protein
MKFNLLAAASALLLSAPGSAATLIIQDGLLMGATGVSVDGVDYDVSFANGLCTSLFAGCSDRSAFTFATRARASLAAMALLEEVLVDSEHGNFDSHPELTAGCSSAVECLALIPYASSGGFVSYVSPINTPALFPPQLRTSAILRTMDTSAAPTMTFALFSPSSSPVPEPAAWAMMLVGFGAVGYSMRRQNIARARVGFA